MKKRLPYIVVPILIALFTGAWAAALAADDGATCFDKQQVFDAARRLNLHMRWSGVEGNLDQVETAITMPEKTLVLFLKNDGTTWSLWTFKGEEGCLNTKGPKWEHHKVWGEHRL